VSAFNDPLEVRSFLPVVGEHAHTLILGSAPGIRSLREVQYYAHPRNSFWRIMSTIAGFSAELRYPDRLDALIATGFALWDVLAECERRTSLDSDIVESSIVANDLAGLLNLHPSIRRIAFNGAKADAAFQRYVSPTLNAGPIATVRLPSTSPAHASMRVEEKLTVWSESLRFD
jgi:TDG/mug DNA glycosylase family protein